MKLRAFVTAQGMKSIRDLQQLVDVRGTMAEQLNDAADQVFQVSQRRVPVDTGTLKGSGSIDRATVRHLLASVYYTAEYALIVHEIHSTQAQYLVGAVDVVMDNMPKKLADAIVVRVK